MITRGATKASVICIVLLMVVPVSDGQTGNISFETRLRRCFRLANDSGADLFG